MQVSIEFKDVTLGGAEEKNTTVNVVHIKDDASTETIKSDINIKKEQLKTVDFTTDEFSIYAVTTSGIEEKHNSTIEVGDLAVIEFWNKDVNGRNQEINFNDKYGGRYDSDSRYLRIEVYIENSLEVDKIYELDMSDDNYDNVNLQTTVKPGDGYYLAQACIWRKAGSEDVSTFGGSGSTGMNKASGNPKVNTLTIYLTTDNPNLGCSEEISDSTRAISVDLYNYDSESEEITLIEEDVSRGQEVKAFMSEVITKDDNEYVKIKIDDDSYYVDSDNLVDKKEDVVLEKEVYVRTASSILESTEEPKILGLANKGDKLEIIVTQPSGVIGPYEYIISNLGQLIIDCANKKIGAYIEGGYNFVDVRDVVDGLIKAGEKGRNGECYILSGQFVSIKQLMQYVQDITGVEAPKFKIARWFAYATGFLSELYYKIAKEKPLFTSYAVYTTGTNSNFSNEKAIKELGYKVTDIKDTIRDTVYWFESQGKIKLNKNNKRKE